ncbi:sesquipedalian-1 [Stegostoma tigrinum]|uniref:sesquipedalian-1 n=1 Tax=Stegostoma tigrinum TaxID=3053191 RepID=UPI00202B5AB4|nr:sesquipedalian-1 [Stegostoma tigrinum]
MKLNERSVAYYATCDSPTDKTGYLHKKGERNTAYHRRWFVLKGNLFFYFEEKDSKDPIGVIVLEGCTVELCESSEDYAFAIKFDSAKSRTYKMAAESQREMESWVKALSRASFDYMRIVVKELEKQLEEMQQNRSSSRKSQRKSLLRKQGSTPHSSPLISHNFAVSYRTPVKENGYVPWNTIQDQITDSELNGKAHTVNDNNDISKCFLDHAPERPLHTQRLPPPLPPRRRSATGGVTSVTGGLMLAQDDNTPAGVFGFTRLHEWFGRDIIQLRRQWQENKFASNDRSQLDQMVLN